MKTLRYSLLADGPRDSMLIPIINWLLVQHLPEYALVSQMADLSQLVHPPRTLENRIRKCVDLYPCEILFIHRDSEGDPLELRCDQIREAVAKAQALSSRFISQTPPTVCVVPVRMSEAWLLFDEAAIRKAASNPQGKDPVNLPKIKDVERIADPKQVLHGFLRTASGLRGHRLKYLDESMAAITGSGIHKRFRTATCLVRLREI